MLRHPPLLCNDQYPADQWKPGRSWRWCSGSLDTWPPWLRSLRLWHWEHPPTRCCYIWLRTQGLMRTGIPTEIKWHSVRRYNTVIFSPKIRQLTNTFHTWQSPSHHPWERGTVSCCIFVRCLCNKISFLHNSQSRGWPMFLVQSLTYVLPMSLQLYIQYLVN